MAHRLRAIILLFVDEEAEFTPQPFAAAQS